MLGEPSGCRGGSHPQDLELQQGRSSQAPGASCSCSLELWGARVPLLPLSVGVSGRVGVCPWASDPAPVSPRGGHRWDSLESLPGAGGHRCAGRFLKRRSTLVFWVFSFLKSCRYSTLSIPQSLASACDQRHCPLPSLSLPLPAAHACSWWPEPGRLLLLLSSGPWGCVAWVSLRKPRNHGTL